MGRLAWVSLCIGLCTRQIGAGGRGWGLWRREETDGHAANVARARLFSDPA